jgi:chromosome segregation ATPase
MLGSEETPAQPSAVLAPGEVFLLEQSSELERQRARAKKLADKIDRLLAANNMNQAQLKDRDERVRERDDLLRDKTVSLRKAEADAAETARLLRQAKTDLEEKERLLREKDDLVRESDARLKTYESAKRDSERRIRELEKQLAKAAARPTRAGPPEGEWPTLLKNNLVLGAQVRALKTALETLDNKETDPEVWSAAMQEATEIIDGLSGRLKSYPITDSQANDARSFLSDTLPVRLYALKKQKR